MKLHIVIPFLFSIFKPKRLAASHAHSYGSVQGSRTGYSLNRKRTAKLFKLSFLFLSNSHSGRWRCCVSQNTKVVVAFLNDRLDLRCSPERPTSFCLNNMRKRTKLICTQSKLKFLTAFLHLWTHRGCFGSFEDTVRRHCSISRIFCFFAIFIKFRDRKTHRIIRIPHQVDMWKTEMGLYCTQYDILNIENIFLALYYITFVFLDFGANDAIP